MRPEKQQAKRAHHWGLPVTNNVGTHSKPSRLRQSVDDPKKSFILSLGKFAKINPKMLKEMWSLQHILLNENYH